MVVASKCDTDIDDEMPYTEGWNGCVAQEPF